jgi:hypothetical protein
VGAAGVSAVGVAAESAGESLVSLVTRASLVKRAFSLILSLCKSSMISKISVRLLIEWSFVIRFVECASSSVFFCCLDCIVFY